MDKATFVTLLATFIGVAASVFVLKSFLAQTPADTAALASSRSNYSLPILDSLAQQRGDSVTGAVAFVFAFVLAGAGVAFVPAEIPLFKSPLGGGGVALLALILLLGALQFASTRLARYHAKAARRVLVEQEFDWLVLGEHYNYHYTNGLAESASKLMGIGVNRYMSPNEILTTVAQQLGRSLPSNVPTIQPEAPE